MYSSEELSNLIIIVSVVFCSIMAVGLALSIAVFYTKKVYFEVIAWICSAVWLFVFFYLRGSTLYESVYILNFAIYPTLLTMILLVHYRTRFLDARKFKIIHLLKFAFCFVIQSLFFSRVITLLYNARILNPMNHSLAITVQITLFIIAQTVMVVLCMLYLQKTSLKTNGKDIFGDAVVFTFSTFFLSIVFGTVINLLSVPASQYSMIIKEILSGTNLLIEFIYMVVGGIISAIIAAYLFYSKVSRKVA
jgi:hypothetical protein